MHSSMPVEAALRVEAFAAQSAQKLALELVPFQVHIQNVLGLEGLVAGGANGRIDRHFLVFFHGKFLRKLQAAFHGLLFPQTVVALIAQLVGDFQRSQIDVRLIHLQV